MKNIEVPGYGDAVRASVWRIDPDNGDHFCGVHNFPAGVTLAAAQARFATVYYENYKIVWSFYDSDTIR